MARSKKKKRKPESAPSRSIRRAWPLAAVLVIAGAAAVAWFGLQSGPAALVAGAFQNDNVLIVTIDTIRADRLGSYGSDAGLTQNLDRLASEGIRFEEALAHVPVTLPSHTSLFTARYPTEHGVHDNGAFRLDASIPTLATILREAGYETGAFVSAFVLDARFGLNRGFDHYDDYYGEKREFLSFSQLERRADAALGPAAEWILKKKNAPWLAWVHLFDPHTPYDAPTAPAGQTPYDREVAYTDARLGAFLDRLAAAGRLEKTLVVIVGDHGESLGEHGEKTHGTFAYHSTLRVPWIVWRADGLDARVFDGAVRLIDVTPTLLDLLGVPADAGFTGQSLRAFVSGAPYEPPPSYFEALNVHLTRDWAPLRGVVQDGFKLIDLPIPELYDLRNDPTERRNLYAEEPERAARLERTLSELTGDELDVGASELPDQEMMARLRSLGYVSAPVENRKSEYSIDDDPKRLVGISNDYDQVTELIGQGRIPETVRILERIVEQQPRSAEAYRGLAYSLHQTGRLAEAIATLERGITNGVQEPALMGTLGAYLLDAGQVPKAVDLLELLVDREPDYAEAHNYLGIAYGRMGRFDDSRRALERVIELDPSSAASYNNLGSLALSQGDVDGAIEALTRALEFDARNANTHNGLGVAYARRGDMAQAIESWKRAVEANPSQFDALYNVALALADRSPRDAVPYLERFIRDAPRERYQADIARASALVREIAASR